MTTLPERLLEMCRTPDGHDLPDHAEPWGADVATLREAAAALQAAPEGGEVCIVCDWKDADPFPRFIEAEVGGRSVAFEWRYRNDGLKELVIPTQGETK